MSSKSTKRCSCGEKLKTGIALLHHRQDSPKHNTTRIIGNTLPKTMDSKAKPVAMKTNPESSAQVKNMQTFNVASSASPVVEAATAPLVCCAAKAKGKEPAPIVTTIEETPTEKLESVNAKVKEAQSLHDRLIAKLSELLEFEITRELKAAIKKELKPVLKRDLEDDIKAEFGGDLKKLKSEMVSDLISEIKADFKKAVKEEIKNEFRMTVAYQLSSKNEMKTEPMDDLKSELKAELKIELMEELKDSNKSESNEKSTDEPQGNRSISSEEDFLTVDDMVLVGGLGGDFE
ncbi:hypothetical protein VC83_01863 [Pseudogymnoascus destructans]|uniref:Uncharacterized protein n=2 Tax=Pseudogymnoascus destructans TaxID=655981 RepID=L8G8P3_PSED2|nr:uncharacterized protein VC83_01863 [Pseudogymnoascus destructans]ELR09229.1 hypothetical protein GMDG_03802 [Pseudogymnoascus destructans 20631-21]OAF61684.1 hypothetical protein VC83_01863 [Pseudogymnoascus destructans]